MKLDWDRPGVLRATLKVQELATLVAGARIAAAALAGQSEQQAGELERVLLGFDRAATRLSAPPQRQARQPVRSERRVDVDRAQPVGREAGDRVGRSGSFRAT